MNEFERVVCLEWCVRLRCENTAYHGLLLGLPFVFQAVLPFCLRVFDLLIRATSKPKIFLLQLYAAFEQWFHHTIEIAQRKETCQRRNEPAVSKAHDSRFKNGEKGLCIVDDLGLRRAIAQHIFIKNRILKPVTEP